MTSTTRQNLHTDGYYFEHKVDDDQLMEQMKLYQQIREKDGADNDCLLPTLLTKTQEADELQKLEIEPVWNPVRGRMDYGTTVRNNLIYEKGYTPYCGLQGKCYYNWPRTTFTGEQFKCKCGFETRFEKAFITEYKAKWSLD